MESREQSEQAAAAWITRRDVGPWSDADAAALNEWLAQSPSHRVAYYRLNAAWQEAGRLQALVGNAPVVSKRSPLTRTQVRWRSLAAALVLAIGVSAVAFKATRAPNATHATVVGGLESVPMADGSRVILNTNSELSIALSKSERRVELSHGEAFFEVAKDPNRPFVVTAGDKRIIAVGTAFSVRRDGDNIRLIVSEGTVRMEMPSKKQEYASPGPLKAGSIVRARRDDMLVQTQALAEIERTLSWRSGLLTFRDTPLSTAIGEFNRYNTRQIVIEDEQIASLQIGGIFRATQPDAFVRLLQEGFPIHAVTEDTRIVIRAN